MAKQTINIQIIQDGDERYLLKQNADGTEERVLIVKLPRKPPRYRYRKARLDAKK